MISLIQKFCWGKLKKVRQALKGLNAREFDQVATRVEQARDELHNLQRGLQLDSNDISLQQQEKKLNDQLIYWLQVE